MSLEFKNYKALCFVLVFVLMRSFCFSQGDTSTIKAQIALGVNSPSSSGFVDGFESKSVNFPTVNLGIQYMFKPMFGAKLDFSFNRLSNLSNTPEFKVNYTRFNLQLVYNASKIFGLSKHVGVFAHVGPGFSMVKPLGNYPQNKTSFLNVIGGMEFHYGISDTVSLFLDTSYILGFGKAFSPVSSGFGSFNGNLLTVSMGLSISLSGCYYCEQ